eukprot:TRINITY_DN47390_c0_g1_i1.p1 TRINITY_DN47390_c0_g1~~TRINITY_DN47390_c0_g1_i1.p1  ORF type:complete len:319 (+),score=61.37 TRINITY_DN47390_c0_g1_i1:58-957(+)
MPSNASSRRPGRRQPQLGIAAAGVCAVLLLCLAAPCSRAAAGSQGSELEPASPPSRAEVPSAHSAALAGAWRQIDSLAASVLKVGIVPQFGQAAEGILRRAIAAAGASGGEALALEQAIDAPLEALFRQQLQRLVARAVDRYEEVLAARPNPVEARKAAAVLFLEGAKALVRPGSKWSYEVEHQDLLNLISKGYSQDVSLIEEQGKQGQGKHLTIEVIRKLQQQLASVQREVETRGAFPWNVRWQYFMDKSPLGFRGQYAQGRSVVELLLMPSPDPRLKKNFLNRLGPLNLAVAFDMLL